MKKIIFALCILVISTSSHAYDMRDYFPKTQRVSQYVNNAGKYTHTYVFTPNSTPYVSLYNTYLNLNKPGQVYTWQKTYLINGVNCTKTVAVLLFGDDQTITEVGDWTSGAGCTPNTVFGYRNASTGKPTGLLWSGGIAEMQVISQDSPGAAYSYKNWSAFSKTGTIEHLDTMLVNGHTYSDVVHIIMYHGTRAPTPKQVRCIGPIAANGGYYQSYKDFNSYAMELWLAKGIGIIKEDTPFIEDASYWGWNNCAGNYLTGDKSLERYLIWQ